MICVAEDLNKLQEQVKTFQTTFKNNKFGAEDLKMVFRFLSKYAEAVDNLGGSKAHAF